MLFSWFKRRRRRNLRRAALPEAWREVLERNVHHYQRLQEHLRLRLSSRWEWTSPLNPRMFLARPPAPIPLVGMERKMAS